MNKEEIRKKLKPFGNVIQICPNCHKIDVVLGHEEECSPELEIYIKESLEHGVHD